MRPSDADASVLRLLVEGTAAETGAAFFRALVRNLCQAMGTAGAWLTEYDATTRRLRALAFWFENEWVSGYEYDVEGTPCQPVIDERCFVHFPENVVDLFPDDPDLPRLRAVSYMGAPILGADGILLGHLALLHTAPLPRDEKLVAIFELFAERAAAEYRRLVVERRLRASEEQLARLLESALDAILVLDAQLQVVRANPAAERTFAAPAEGLVGRQLSHLLEAESARDVELRARALAAEGSARRGAWLPGGLAARRCDGRRFPAEATFASFESQGQRFFTLILRDVDERLAAERRLALLADEAASLREALGEAPEGAELLGRSPAMLGLQEAIDRVAATDTTVLVLGETGTGKELVARTIHRRSPRRERPLVRVNCAAIPGTLIESELFGHEKGAFTGATSRREGRFALADGGTIFLDEVGELPLDLQAKLLRVLQEGEFEPLGSARTRRVDVRVVAATNRDLEAMVGAGRFREDLFYRLHVFPLHVPPLRERGEDVGLLAASFADRLARRMGRRIEPLDPASLRRLAIYPWPGNVRELQNVVERALILSPGPRIEIERALPLEAERGGRVLSPPAVPAPEAPILTAAELEAFERENLVRALEACGGKVAGEHGAARLLGLPPSTFSSRMKALGVRRPGRENS